MESSHDFEKLGEKYPEFKKHLIKSKNGKSLDWKNGESILELTKTILHNDFGIKFDLPLKNLCPPVSQRLNYILWINKLIGREKKGTIKGLDIGTGASCIFPLLGKAKFDWEYLATDIDEESVKWAKKLVKLNNWENSINVKLVDKNDNFFDIIKNENCLKYDFTMCNPPFFENIKETGLNRKRKSSGTKNELICDGGEIEFVSKMIGESLKFKKKINLFTTMLGKKSSLKVLKKKLLALKANVKSTLFVQGKQYRWGLAWKFPSKSSNLDLFLNCTKQTAVSTVIQCLKLNNIKFSITPDQFMIMAQSNLDPFDITFNVTFTESQNIVFIKFSFQNQSDFSITKTYQILQDFVNQNK